MRHFQLSSALREKAGDGEGSAEARLKQLAENTKAYVARVAAEIQGQPVPQATGADRIYTMSASQIAQLPQAERDAMRVKLANDLAALQQERR